MQSPGGSLFKIVSVNLFNFIIIPELLYFPRLSSDFVHIIFGLAWVLRKFFFIISANYKLPLHYLF